MDNISGHHPITNIKRDLRPALQKIFGSEAPPSGVLHGVRKLRKGLPGKKIIFFPSLKNNGLIPCESRLEAAFCLFLERDRAIQRYRSQPVTIDFGPKGKYTSDFAFLRTDDAIELREIKFSGAMKDPNIINLYSMIKDALDHLNIGFSVETEEMIYQAPRLGNLKYLYRGARLPNSELISDLALAMLQESGNTFSLREFHNALQQAGISPLMAENLMFRELACFDESLPVGPHSQIWARGKV
ncbi:hypothetical protein HF669_15490 [Acidithiobacillus thiooxidans]|uniref:hypothetical protein n=1 Tax=Acidithiobacillus thiooxidans TaxID=930 RepID=UPI0002625002|nr:hypothetical protein [Acidithiobacillus thiooxidans]MBU2812717.1 hypothetical protein [Acidithiobacillus thiooxidans]